MKNKLTRGLISSVILIVIMFGCGSEGGHGKGKNHAPVITSLPNTLGFTSELYLYDVKASDADGDFLTYTLITFPEGMTIDSATGEINWLPTLRQVGNHPIEVRVSDGPAGDSQLFAIRVSPLDNGVPFQRGITLVAWGHDDYLQPSTAEGLLQMKEDGCEWVSILVWWWQDTINSTTIHRVDWTQSDTGLINAINAAHSLGMNVILKPHVEVLTGAWRGDITFSNEADWQAWFDSYNHFLGHYLNLAQENHVEAVIIGTELKKTESREADWRRTIALARSRYSGLLTYCANHDSFANINWWDDLDFIGISAYFKLTDSDSPTVEQIKSAWDLTKMGIRAVAAFYDKDVVFTEIGYTSRNGTNIRPYEFNPAALPDLQEQADCYQAALETFYDEPWFKGIYWWAWYWDHSTDDNGFDFYNKPAETIVRQWYAGY